MLIYFRRQKNKAVLILAMNCCLFYISATGDTFSDNQTSGKYLKIFLIWRLYQIHHKIVDFGI